MNKLVLSLFVFLGLTVCVFFASAATGTIDSVNKYCWSNNIGWINFGCASCNVSVSDTAITGYAWSTDFGWINLHPTLGGVHNTTSGVLSGYAWGESAGWINFTGVSINTSTGIFSGTATGDVVGTVNFSCTETGCPVTTTWRPDGTSCGDGTCNDAETCSTCPADCGACCDHDLVCDSGETCPSCGDCCGECVGSHTECSLERECILVRCPGINQCVTGDNCKFCVPGSNQPCTQAFGTCTTDGTQTCNQDGTAWGTCSAVDPRTGNCSEKECGSDGCGGNCGTCPSGTCSNGQCIPFCVPGSNQPCTQAFGTCTTDGTQTCNQDGTAWGTCSAVDPRTGNCSEKECGSDGCGGSCGFCPSGVCDNGQCISDKHNECNEEKQCVAVDGEGPDSCQIDDDCLTTHNECDGLQCIPISGFGINQCYSDDECLTPIHNECDGSQCVLVDGEGPDLCQTNNDCPVETHAECNEEKQCVSVDGEGDDQCSNSDDCQLKTHTECNEEKQCVSVDGEGDDKCQTDDECYLVKNMFLKTKKIIDSPQGSVVTKTVSTTGLLISVIGSVGYFPFFDIFLILLRLLDFLLILFGLKKKAPPWGVVYDSVTKRPLDPAYVVLKNLQGKQIASAITDLDGRYGFLVEPGVYQMQANKTNYIFPSQKLAGKTYDEIYADLYFGEQIEVKKAGDVIIKNIPLDPVKFDWNEFAKKKKGLILFYSKWDAIIRKIYDFFFVLGFVVALISYIFAPYPYNATVMILYLVFLLFRVLGLKPKTYGYITDKTTGNPLSFAIVRVLLPDSNILVTSKSVDKYGKYYCLVPLGRYYVKIEKKNEDGSYSLVYTSPVLDVSKEGIIKEKFRV